MNNTNRNRRSQRAAPATMPDRTARPRPLIMVNGRRIVRTVEDIYVDMMPALYQRCEKADNINADLTNLADWPDEPRLMLLSILNKFEKRTTFWVGTQQASYLFDSVLTAMVGPADLQAHGRSLQAATEAAILMGPELAATTAKRINDRVRELGGAPQNHQQLTKAIRMGAEATDTDSMHPQSLARAFIESIRPPGGRTDELAWLAYFRSNFYDYSGQIWRAIDDGQLSGRVTQFLQERAASKPVTARLVNDVMINLRAMVSIGAGTWTQRTTNGRPQAPSKCGEMI